MEANQPGQSLWTEKGPVSVNPYDLSAFKAAGVPPDLMQPEQINQMIEQRRQAVQVMPGRIIFAGRPLTLADLTAARRLLLDPNQRMLESLLEHTPESFPAEELEVLRERMRNLPVDLPAAAVEERLPGVLVRLTQTLACSFAAELPAIEVPARPVDLDPIPPFGKPEGSSR